MTTRQIIATQLTSGRWILTVTAAFIFAYTACTGIIPGDDIDTILAVIITFYFTKTNITATNDSTKETSNEDGSSPHVQ